MLTAAQLVHEAAGYPEHKYKEEDHSGVCATCAAGIETGIPTSQINNKTFSGQAEFFKFGTHVCRACAWLYGAGKGKPGNIFAHGDTYVRPVLSPDSSDDDRPSWVEALRGIDGGECASGVMTADTKPRLWPRMRTATTERFGLYVHAQDYGVSEYRSFDLAEMLLAVEAISGALARGFSKHRVYGGLMHDYQRFTKDPKGVMALEEEIAVLRGSAEFVPALLAAHKSYATRTADAEMEDRGNRRDAFGAVGGGETRGRVDQDHARLF